MYMLYHECCHRLTLLSNSLFRQETATVQVKNSLSLKKPNSYPKKVKKCRLLFWKTKAPPLFQLFPDRLSQFLPLERLTLDKK